MPGEGFLRHVAPKIRHVSCVGWKLVLTQRVEEKVEGVREVLGERAALVVRPKAPAPGSPWIWRTEFFGHEPQADIALLGRGFHVAYVDMQNLYGAPVAVQHMERGCAIRGCKAARRTSPALEIMGQWAAWAGIQPKV